jgi:chloramphenicol-sensitive protein RarD
MRKIMGVGSIEGLTVEMTFVLPICIALQWWLFTTESSEIFSGNWFVTIGLLLGGLVTMMPLLLFASAARRLKLSTLGILQYISPTGQLLLATFVFKEDFGFNEVVVFSLIWIAVALYSFDTWRSSSKAVEPCFE